MTTSGGPAGRASTPSTEPARVSQAEGAVRRAANVWAGAVTSGQFFTVWSAAVSLIIAALFSIPSVGPPSLAAYGLGVIVGACGWLVLAVVVVPVAVLERRVRDKTVRAVLVLGAIGVVGAARSFVNDAISIALFDIPTSGSPLPRVATNLVTFALVFSIVAMTTMHYRAARAGDERLRIALARMRLSIDRAERFAADSLVLIDETTAALRARRDQLLAGPLDFDTVRAFSEHVRAASHRFDTLARAESPTPDTGDLIVSPHRPPRLGERLVPTPWCAVGLIYAAAGLPFALAAGGPLVGASALVLSCIVDIAVGLIVRGSATRAASPGARAAAFIVSWSLGGGAMLAVTYALLPGVGSLGLVPLLAIPVTAVVVSLCRDALTRAHEDEARSAAVLADIARTLAATRTRTRGPLQRTSEMLHGTLQGRCVIFAAAVDEHAPTPAVVSAFRDGTDAVFAEIGTLSTVVRSGAHLPPEGVGARTSTGLDQLLAAWASAVEVRADIDAAATAALSDPSTAAAVSALVNEALVNAVKHSAAREATVEVTVVDGEVRVRVSSPGELGPAERVNPGLGTGTGAARVRQDGDRVVLEAVVRPAEV